MCCKNFLVDNGIVGSMMGLLVEAQLVKLLWFEDLIITEYTNTYFNSYELVCLAFQVSGT